MNVCEKCDFHPCKCVTTDLIEGSSEIVRNRITVYTSETAQVYDFYAKNDKSVKVEGTGSIEEIFERLKTEIDKTS